MGEEVSLQMRSAAVDVVRRLRAAGFESYWVGGCVRDLLLGIEPLDYDVATSATPEQAAPLFESTREVGRAFGVLQVRCADSWIEVATFRSEGGYSDGRHPDSVHPADARTDVLRRDFTINALLMNPLDGQVLDYVGGRRDLEQRQLRAVGDPAQRFQEDALRLLRAVRFTCRFDLEIEPATRQALVAQAHRIRLVAAERARDELLAMLLGPRPRRALTLLLDSGLLDHIAPEVKRLRGCEQSPRHHPEGDVWEHTLQMLEHMQASVAQPDAALALGVLLHDVGKPDARQRVGDQWVFHGHEKRGQEIAETVMQRLRVPNKTQSAVQMLIGQHMRFISVREMRRSTLRRFILQEGFDRLLELHRLDALSSRGDLTTWEACRRELESVAQEEPPVRPLLSGDDLIERGYRAGPRLGVILRALVDAQLEGSVRDRERAIAWVREHFAPDPDEPPAGATPAA
ncbi:MAG: CCA tRNA nucleotidyltransferase [Candidatus Latescibacterota bacterium]|nr:MAG: CCA tRNA nucleotidyltransferase [Candidatus Latescibacterota bacterium]